MREMLQAVLVMGKILREVLAGNLACMARWMDELAQRFRTDE